MQERQLPDGELKKIAIKVKEMLYAPVSNFTTTVFLCGADITQKDKLRSKIADVLNEPSHLSSFDIIYPEEIFDEILYNSKDSNLLSLENILAESVDVIVIIPESPGSFTELGAFVNDEKLRRKVICVIDKQYERKKSFINQGPVKLVKVLSKERVIYIDPNNVKDSSNKLTNVIRSVKRTSSKKSDKLTLIQLNNFILPAVYLLEPISKLSLQKLIGFAIDDQKSAGHVTMAALSVLLKKHQIEHSSNGYKLTKIGLDDFLDTIFPKNRLKRKIKPSLLDDLRLEVLNLTLRHKKLRI